MSWMSFEHRGAGCLEHGWGIWSCGWPHLLQIQILCAAQQGEELASVSLLKQHHHNEVVPVRTPPVGVMGAVVLPPPASQFPIQAPAWSSCIFCLKCLPLTLLAHKLLHMP